MPEPAAAIPTEITAALDRLKTELAAHAGSNLACLVLFGGLARGRYRPGYSDVNVVVVLHEITPAALQVIAPALHTAWRAAAVEPMLLKHSELAMAAQAFPTKFLDIKNHHRVLAGDDLFTGLNIDAGLLRLRTAQELANLLLRLRRRYLAVAGEPPLLTRALGDMARPFALQLQNLLVVAGKPVPEVDRTVALFEAASAVFDLPAEPLRRLAELRHNPGVAADVDFLAGAVLDALAKAATLAARMKDAPG